MAISRATVEASIRRARDGDLKARVVASVANSAQLRAELSAFASEVTRLRAIGAEVILIAVRTR